MTKLTKYRTLLLALTLLLLAASWALWFFVANQNAKLPESRVAVEREDWFELRIGSEPVLFFNHLGADSAFVMPHVSRDSTLTRTRTEGRWTNRYGFVPSCYGRISAQFDSLQQHSFDLAAIISHNIDLVQLRLQDLDTMAEEMEYFFEVHHVEDAGYELVTDRYEHTLRETARLTQVLQTLKLCADNPALSLHHEALYKATYADRNGNPQTDTCAVNGRFLQIVSRSTPRAARPILPSAQTEPKEIAKTVPCDTIAWPRDGFGLRVTAEHGVQLGEWENGRYKGERLEHNPNRIYGIDIARYQHEQGRRRYSINWNNLRITSLGNKSKKQIQGKVDYPVSFCYIKATEGTNIRNRYYAADYQQASKHGIRVGSYHFFSTKSLGKQQANWFLKNLRHKKGDLPPVIDIEPSDAQIRRYGGIDRLFAEVRVLLRMVEERTGQRPILYINQRFVNNYLSLAPDIKRYYVVWIARYGEYKPDVHMLFWQLSPDGRVRGITPQVDINVFNGNEEKFQRFLQQLDAPES